MVTLPLPALDGMARERHGSGRVEAQKEQSETRERSIGAAPGSPFHTARESAVAGLLGLPPCAADARRCDVDARGASRLFSLSLTFAAQLATMCRLDAFEPVRCSHPPHRHLPVSRNGSWRYGISCHADSRALKTTPGNADLVL
jgi:hypothetical protein